MIKKEWHWMPDYKQQKQITMDKKEETIYCGSGKVMNPKWLKVTINPSKISEYIQIKLNINLKDEADQYGKDVSISVDTWKPDAEAPKAEASNTSNDLPF
jgi:YbbR domain-containing protein